MVKMVNGSRYYTAPEIRHQLCLPFLPFTHARSESINADSLNSNFLQLGRRSGGQPQRTVHSRRLPVNTVIHTTLVGLEPTTFQLLFPRATSSATDSLSILSQVVDFILFNKFLYIFMGGCQCLVDLSVQLNECFLLYCALF